MTKIRIGIAQFNPTVGAYRENVRKITSWIQKASKKRADLIVFPELSLCGYPVWDLANKKAFLEEGERALAQLVRLTRGKRTAVVLGFVQPGSHGRQSSNALAWIERGRLKAVYQKRLLPTYDVFLEDIFFRPGKKSAVIPWKKFRVGPTICEDLWDTGYERKPAAELKKRGANLIINISASPYYRGVLEQRDVLMKHHAVSQKVPILYVNQTGGQDDLIFDGRSFFVDAEGRVLFRAPRFREGLFFFDWDTRRRFSESLPIPPETSRPGEVYQALVTGVRDYFKKNRFRKAIIGLSGGIDSALVAALAVDALGRKAVKGIAMPGKYSSRGSWEDASRLAKNLGIEFAVMPIRKAYQQMLGHYAGRRAGRRVTTAMENLQARLRGLGLMYLSNEEGRLLLSTGNKSELAMGYCTLYGDMAGGLGVLGDVYKTDVYRLARYRNQKGAVIPEEILRKPPSAELRPGQTDQDSLPPYEILDQILYLYIEKNKSRDEIVQELGSRGIPSRMIQDVIRKVDHNEYKRRQSPPILRVTEKAWFGRRMPITNRFEN